MDTHFPAEDFYDRREALFDGDPRKCARAQALSPADAHRTVFEDGLKATGYGHRDIDTDDRRIERAKTRRQAQALAREAEYQRRLDALNRGIVEPDAPPSNGPVVIALRSGLDMADIERFLPACCTVVSADQLGTDILYRIRVPRWPYKGRSAILSVADSELGRSYLLGVAP